MADLQEAKPQSGGKGTWGPHCAKCGFPKNSGTHLPAYGPDGKVKRLYFKCEFVPRKDGR